MWLEVEQAAQTVLKDMKFTGESLWNVGDMSYHWLKWRLQRIFESMFSPFLCRGEFHLYSWICIFLASSLENTTIFKIEQCYAVLMVASAARTQHACGSWCQLRGWNEGSEENFCTLQWCVFHRIISFFHCDFLSNRAQHTCLLVILFAFCSIVSPRAWFLYKNKTSVRWVAYLACIFIMFLLL